MLIFGATTYGKVDKLPGHFFIATKFIHLYFVPLIPVGSYLIVEGSEKDDQWQGVSIPLNCKSMVFGWLQIICPVVGILGSLFGTARLIGWFNGVHADWAPFWQAPASWLLLAVWIATFYYNRATPQRAFELAPLLGLTPERVAGAFVSQDEIPQFLAHHEVEPSKPTDTTPSQKG